MSERKAVSKSKRFQIFHRDGFICQYCGLRPPDVVLELDHIHPVSKGGDNSDVNLITACEACNRGKSDKVLSERAVRPDADLAFLKVQQEIVEAQRFLEAEIQRERVTQSLVEAIQKIWDDDCQMDHYVPYDETVRGWLNRYTPEVIVSSIRRVSWMIRAGRIKGGMDGAVRYVSGAIHRTACGDFE
jgi:hypothetical protein